MEEEIQKNSIPTQILELNHLFLNNFSQRYTITYQTIKRYFSQIKTETLNENENELPLSILSLVMERFLVAISTERIHQLVQYYDIHDNQHITYLELFQLLANPTLLSAYYLEKERIKIAFNPVRTSSKTLNGSSTRHDNPNVILFPPPPPPLLSAQTPLQLNPSFETITKKKKQLSFGESRKTVSYLKSTATSINNRKSKFQNFDKLIPFSVLPPPSPTLTSRSNDEYEKKGTIAARASLKANAKQAVRKTSGGETAEEIK